MLDKSTLRSNAAERLTDAQILLDNGRYDGAAYICGYAVEFALKARICDTLNITTYPEKFRDFKTHKFDDLLLFTGRAADVNQNAFDAWSVVTGFWQAEMRYKARGTVLPADAQAMLDATKTLMQIL